MQYLKKPVEAAIAPHMDNAAQMRKNERQLQISSKTRDNEP